VLGSSFIGLEVAAALRTRDKDVTVVAPEDMPFVRVFGQRLGEFIRDLHTEKGVRFALGKTPARIDDAAVHLSDGSAIAADAVIVGVGVVPALELAESAGLQTDNGMLVDEYLVTNVPDVYAAGDNACWPDPHSGERIRVEHWVVAERMGQTVARNMLGFREPFQFVPFFWTQHYDVAVNYVGHASKIDSIEEDGDPAARDYSARLIQEGQERARITIFRDLESLQREAAMEASI
jgi:NADPH-dependent 2,4-dienoyl-CoA reductase/sulfur reductase-like enzyme